MGKSVDVINWRKRTKQKMVKAMGDKCQVCGYDRCVEALEFHHIDPSTKMFSFSSVVANPKKLDTIVEELEKCIMLCSNCHKEFHAGHIILPEKPKMRIEYLKSEAALKKILKQDHAKKTIVKASKDRRKIKLTCDELIKLLNEHGGNKSSLAKMLGVSETAIRKRLKSKYQK